MHIYALCVLYCEPVEVIIADQDLNTFNTAASVTGLSSTLQGSVNDFTVFAPINSAFDDVISELDGIESLDDLLSSPSLGGGHYHGF